MLEKKQVHSFLKILQIPTDQSAEEIELALKKAGWNAKDAKEAVGVLFPEGEKDKKSDPAPVTEPQFVAQVTKPKGVSQASRPAPKDNPPPVPISDDQPSRVPPKLEVPAYEPPAPPVPAAKELRVSIVPRPEQPAPAKENTNQPPDGAAGLPSFTPESITHSEAATNVTVRPVTPDGMARQLFRSDDHRLSAETITNLLGIDVDVRPDEFEILKRRRHPGLTFPQLLIIVVCSIALAFAALVYGMYLFQVGPFHPTVEAFSF